VETIINLIGEGREWFTFCWCALTVCVAILFCQKKGAELAQTTATSCGILGTFIGIIWALLNFDTSNIEGAIPQLLDGLKFAFITSICGMIVSIIISFFSKVRSSEEIGELMLKELQTLNAKVETVTQSSSLNMERVMTHISVSIDELKGKFNELTDTFKSYTEKQAENNVKALISAVQKVMEDFNAKINDQLGEDFQRLAEAVREMVKWQERYKEALSEWQNKYNQFIQTVSEDFAKMRIQNTQYNEELFNTHNQQLMVFQKDLQEWREHFTKSFEQMKEQIKQSETERAVVTTQIHQSIESSHLAIEQSGKQLSQFIESAKSFSIIAEDLKKVIGTTGNVFIGIDNLANSMTGKAEEITKNLEKITGEMLGYLSANLRGISEALLGDYRELQQAITKINEWSKQINK